MTQVVSFQRYRPPARFDGLPWTNANIYEAPAESGPWTLIDTLPLTPVDTNPAVPRFRNLTTANASDPADLWYQIVFTDAALDVSIPTSPVQNTEAAPSEFGGPCTDWITGEDVAACCNADTSTDSSVFDQVANEAQSLLFQLSGRQFAGTCEQTVRPCRTVSGWGFQVLSRGFVVGWWNQGWWYGQGWPGWYNGTPCGFRALSTVRLSGYPVQEIIQVLIDGNPVSPDTYRLDRKRDLVRVRDPADTSTALRWPACQSLDLDDSQPGTWSVTYTYGQPPPSMGVSAAAQLACELYKDCVGQPCALPKGTTSYTRQGVTVNKEAFTDWVFVPTHLPSRGSQRTSGWRTGMAQVDAFLNSYNRDGLRRRPIWWSPASTLQYPLTAGQ